MDVADLPSPRRDPHRDTTVHVVAHRQTRPNLPVDSCPFCVGGLEAPEPYRVRWFPNRWPALPDDRCEVVLFSPDHDASLATLPAGQVRDVIDLWAERSEVLGARRDVAYVLCFENRGAEVGATIDHPHGQIYAYDHVPRRPRQTFATGWTPMRDRDGPDPVPRSLETSSRAVIASGRWEAWVPWASAFPVAVTLAPRRQVPHLAGLDDTERDDLAVTLSEVLRRLDRLADGAMPYMLWVTQAPVEPEPGTEPWCHVEIVSPWRAPDRLRYIAAAEIGGGEYFNPLAPEDLAARLRALATG